MLCLFACLLFFIQDELDFGLGLKMDDTYLSIQCETCEEQFKIISTFAEHDIFVSNSL